MGLSVLHIKSEVECHVYLFDEEKGIAHAGTYFNIDVRKGEQDLLFVSTDDETVRYRLLYDVAENDSDYRITITKSQFKHYSPEILAEINKAEQGDIQAQFNIGERYYYGDGIEENHEEAVKWYRKAAEQGYAIAQCNIGYCYGNGDGVEKNYEEAVKWYRKAAEQGDADAQTNLGVCYKNGDGVEKNYDEAVKWYRKAAEQGFARAQTNLGYCYYKGNGVEQNYEEVVKWYRKAAEQGNDVAQVNLGYCYNKGNGVDQNDKEAVKWWRKAAEQGNDVAQKNLGVCYEIGYGVEKNDEEAVKWFHKAAEQGNDEAIKGLDRIKNCNNGQNRVSNTQSLQEIIDNAINRLKSKNLCSWDDYKDHIPDNGRGKIKTDMQAYCYLAAYGNSHKKKLDYLFETYWNRLNITQDFEVFDYGCGQGLAAISLLENLDINVLHYLKRITLIDRSPFILSIAERYTRDIINSIKNRYELSINYNIRTISDSLPTSNETFNHPSVKSPISIHLFSNVLDMQFIDLNKMAYAVKHCGSNLHYVLATHPGTDNVDPNGERMTKFFKLLPNSEVDDTNKGITDEGIEWSHLIGFAKF